MCPRMTEPPKDESPSENPNQNNRPSFPKYERFSSYLDEENENAEILDDRAARVLCESCPSGWSRLRRTPSGQKTVDQLLFIGDIIETSYSTGGKVINISRHGYYGLSAYSIVYVDVDAPANKDGSYRENHYRYINELVAQDDRILMLFEANKDEVFIKGKAAGQQTLLRFTT